MDCLPLEDRPIVYYTSDGNALAAVDPANAAYAAMIENAASAALSFDFMICPAS